nr:MAG TPA: hypothetical protein [Caudoviricetes sp.]
MLTKSLSLAGSAEILYQIGIKKEPLPFQREGFI